MSSGKKHSRDGDADEVVQTKKVKKVKTTTTSTTETNDATPVVEEKNSKDKKEKEGKKDKKDKKEKKVKKEKKEKKEKKRKEKGSPADDGNNAVEAANEMDVDIPAQVDAPAIVDDTEEPTIDTEELVAPKKEKKDKKTKDRKDKKDKKSKKSSIPEDTTTAATTTAEPASSSPSSSNGAYAQISALTALPQSDIDSFLTTNHITITPAPSALQRPILQFAHLPPTKLLSHGPFKTFTSPTPIQAASWPFSLAGRDVIGIAETGSGKTYAFALPCVEALSSLPPKQPSTSRNTTHARAVIVSPTRELAMQTHAAIGSLAALVGLHAVCIYGGASKDEQRALLRRGSGADIIVATPGRLKDFLQEGCVSLSEAVFCVLDEADRMLDKGFEEDIKQIIGACAPGPQRQTLMFTATWPSEVRGLAEGFMKPDPVKVIISKDRAAGDTGAVELQANSRIAQTVEVVDPRGKERRLLEILKEAQRGAARNDRIIVFCLYKKETVRVEQFLTQRGVAVGAIHGDLRQEQRTRSLEAFKDGSVSVLLATDVAARGLDIPEVKLVVNLTFPLTIEDYVHRIGRTGRAGKEGKAITLFTEHDKAHSGTLINVLKQSKQPVPEELMKFGTTVKKKQHDAYGAFFKDVDMSKKSTRITFD
ncbi:unnamed protein product [Discula destructiva]